jgi:MFS family permease
VTAADRDPRKRAGRRAAKRLIALHGISSFCYGMVFPYTSIFLSERAGVGTGGVALYYAASGVAGLLVATLLAMGWVRPPRVALGVLGNGLSCIGFLLVPLVASLPAAGLAGSAVGAGQGCFLAAVIPIVSSLVSEDDTRRVFAVRYQVLNATLALGSLVAGVLTKLISRDVVQYLFLVNAVGYVPIALALLSTRRASAADQEEDRAVAPKASDDPVGAMTAARLIRATIGVVLFELVIALFAYSQFESTAPLVAYRLMDTGLGWIPVMIAVNVGVVVIAQLPITRLLERRADVFGLRLAVCLWVTGYLIVAASTILPSTGRFVGLAAYAAMFGLGECAYSCSFYPWMISKVPERELTRITALTNGMMGIGAFAGPAIGVSLLASGSPAIVWLSLAVLCSGAAVITVLRRAGGRRPAAAQLPA